MQIVQHAANHPNYMRYIQRVPEIDTYDENNEVEGNFRYDDESTRSDSFQRLIKTPQGRRPERSDHDLPHYRR